MDKETLKFLQGLTIENARQAFRNAKQEAGQEGISLWKTNAYNLWKTTAEMMQQAITADPRMLSAEESLTLSVDEHREYTRFRKPLFGLEAMKFALAQHIYENGKLFV